MNEQLMLKDQTILENSHCIESSGRLFLYINGKTMREVFDLLIDPEKISEIRENRFGTETVYVGFNHLKAITDEGRALITAMLTKNE